MAKGKARVIVVRLMSATGTGFNYAICKPRNRERMVLRKYDPVVRKHALFIEAKK